MKHRSKKFALLSTLALGAFLLNFSPLHAQEMFIDIVGGGYKMLGPNNVQLEAKQAAFQDQYAYANIRTPIVEDPDNVKYIEISDENGGNGFSLSVEVTDFNGPVNIGKNNFELKNCDQVPTDPTCKTTIEGTAGALTLDTSTNNYTAFGEGPLPLANGSGEAPGKWRIYPSFRLNVPSGTPPGDYSSIITFTIS